MTVAGITMKDYLEKTKSATMELIKLLNELWLSGITLESKKSVVESLKKALNEVSQLSNLEERQMYTENILKQIKQKKEEINAHLIQHGDPNPLDKNYAPMSAIAESILVIAKHGLSCVHGSYSDCKQAGETVGPSIDILDIIWHGRNQAAHFDEIGSSWSPKNRGERKMQQVFTDLANHDTNFQGWNQKYNMAFYVVDLLGWTTYESFEKHMMKLG